MFVLLKNITLPQEASSAVEDIVAALNKATEGLPGVRSSWIVPMSKPVLNAGDIICRMTFGTEREALMVTHSSEWRQRVEPLLADCAVESIGYRITRSGGRKEGPGIWRALVFRVMPHGFPDLARELEEKTLLFPKYISTIRSWALNPVSFVEGPKAYTHVWEQEFDSVEGLTGEYMANPIHWGVVDAYFDADYPEYIVDPQLIQLVGRIDRPVLLGE